MKQSHPPVTINLHTHTERCGHAAGSVADYAKSAARRGLKVLGFSDHTPLPDDRWPSVRMRLHELPSYLSEIEEARKKHPDILFLSALECEYAPEYESFYRDELLGRYNLSYLISGAHFLPLDGGWGRIYGGISDKRTLFAYADYLVAAIRCGLFAFIAHPDLFCNSYLKWDEDAKAASRAICEAASDFKVPLEINGYGLRKPKIDTPAGRRFMYPVETFWEIASEYGVEVVCNSDAHRPEDVAASIDRCRRIRDRYRLREARFPFIGEVYYST